MIHNQKILVWTMFTIVVFCLIISKCHSYPTRKNNSICWSLFILVYVVPDRPTKFQTSRDADRFINRVGKTVISN